MDVILPNMPEESFVPPEPEDLTLLKPVLRGEVGIEHHSILYWVEKNNPRGPIPSNPYRDPQFVYWEYAVKRWSTTITPIQTTTPLVIPIANQEAVEAGFVPLPQ